MEQLRVVFYLLLAISVQAIDASRILCVFPYSGRSHYQMFEVICRGLAERGHRIDMIGHFPTKNSIANYTDIIDLSKDAKSVVNSLTVDFAKHIGLWVTYYQSTKFGSALCDLMGTEDMQKFIKNPPNDPPYDLVITEYFGSPCYLGFGTLLNAPVVVGISFMHMPYVDDFMANPFSYASFSNLYTDKPVIETFTDRLWNFIVNYWEMQKFYSYTSNQNEIMKKYLGLSDIPDVRELEKTVSLALVNSHYSYHGIKPITPAVVEVGGLHIIDRDQKISSELKNWLDSADHGLVYFTLGSLMAIESLPREALLAFYASFAKIAPVKVLVKCSNTTKLPPGLPSNVMTLPWIQQIAVLRHKNTRVFITHGGLMGTQEALYYGIPMIGIPVFYDQTKNVRIMINKNMAWMLNHENINEETVDAALNALLKDPKYRESAKRNSRMFRDRPMSAKETAMYWIEYVIRNGPDSLRSPAVVLPWWKRKMLDVFAFLIVCFVLAIIVSVLLLGILFKAFCKYKRDNEMEKKVK
ncbi:UDP-glucuronosyltransferase 2B1-like isoform X2 [Ceratina calcarata]|uniref:UDP-glucuronosyltransferase n=3 Tax=Ceratina calcarata TaxID=156304 RepID=A0AAJ7N4T5_9HYME|nr:UDP-glucuronosyltransferase 2B1-like isoform X2 [Ceratina calcarata]